MIIEVVIRSLITAVVAYLIGSLNPAILITKAFTGKDIRTMGSGNAGFTNVLRSVGTLPAVLTIISDLLKGVIAVMIGWGIFSMMPVYSEVDPFEYMKYGRYLAGMFVIIGHVFPLYFGFKGGKGVVTAAALLLVLDWRVFLLSISVFLIVFAITRIISLGSIIGVAMYPVFTCLFTYFFDFLPKVGTPDELRFRYVLISTGCAIIISATVIIMHHENIKRLIRGEEKKISAKSKK